MFNYINMMHPDGCQYLVWGRMGYGKQSHLHPTVKLYILCINAGCLPVQYVCPDIMSVYPVLYKGPCRGTGGCWPADALGIIQSRTKLLCSTPPCLTYTYSNDISILLTLCLFILLTLSFIYDTLRSM